MGTPESTAPCQREGWLVRTACVPSAHRAVLGTSACLRQPSSAEKESPMSQQTRTEPVNGNVSVDPDVRHFQRTPQLTGVDPVDTLLLTSSAFVLARCLHVVAELGVADVLNEMPQTTASLRTVAI